jgi:parallel beta-helix repeat protein
MSDVDSNPDWPKGLVLMKTNFNHIGRPVAAIITAFFSLISFMPGAAAPVKSTAEPIVVTLQPGVTGSEIQKTLDALPERGGEVVLPPGEISVHQPIVLCRDFQTLRGSGAATVLRLADNANCPVIIMGEPVNSPAKTVKNLRVSDLFIDGNRSHQQRECWELTGEGSQIRNNGITVQGVSDSLIENVTSARCRSGGLVTTGDVRRLTVRGLEAFDNEFDGLACYQTQDCLFTDLYLHNNPGAGISLDLAFNHNVISNAVLTANDLGIFMRASRNNQFQNLSIHNSHHYGVFMAQAEQQTAKGWEATPMTECVQNFFKNLTASNCGSAAFRVNNANCVNNIVVGMQFTDNVNGGLSLVQPNLVTLE